MGAFPPELGCSAACKTAGLGFVHHLSQSTLKLALVLVQCFSSSIVLYLYLDLLLDLAKNITGQKHYRKHNIPDVSIQEIRVDDEVRGGNVQANWSRVFGKIDGFQNGLSHYCFCSVQYQARLMSIVKPGLINPLTTAVPPDGPSDKQLSGVGKPLGLGLCIKWIMERK